MTAAELARRLHDVVRARARLLVEDGYQHGVRFEPYFDGPQMQRLVSALALLQASTEVLADLKRTADDAAARAVTHGASYAEIAAVRGVSRQAARQQHRKQVAAEKARRVAWEAERAKRAEDLEFDLGVRDDGWPPRKWMYRAPAGTHTIRLVGGPADTQTMRVPVGDDAFAYIDHYRVFGKLTRRYARYSPDKPDSDVYAFTGEYYIRWI
jgi:hypothetical protein